MNPFSAKPKSPLQRPARTLFTLAALSVLLLTGCGGAALSPASLSPGEEQLMELLGVGEHLSLYRYTVPKGAALMRVECWQLSGDGWESRGGMSSPVSPGSRGKLLLSAGRDWSWLRIAVRDSHGVGGLTVQPEPGPGEDWQTGHSWLREELPALAPGQEAPLLLAVGTTADRLTVPPAENFRTDASLLQAPWAFAVTVQFAPEESPAGA